MTILNRKTVTRAGRTFRVDVVADECSRAPWLEMDTLGEVTEWTTFRKAAGQRVLNEDRGARRFYDFAGAVAKARREGLSGKDAAAAAEREFDWLRRWCNDQWHWVGVVVTPLTPDGDPLESQSDSLWGIESDAPAYLEEVTDDLINGLMPTATTI